MRVCATCIDFPLLSFHNLIFFSFVFHKHIYQHKINSKAFCWKHKCIFNVSLRWLYLAPHQTEISLSSRLCPWRRFHAKPAHPQAPFLPETTQPISYPGAETWGWTKPVFLNLKAWVCISVTTSVEGVLLLPFLPLCAPTGFVYCCFLDYFK